MTVPSSKNSATKSAAGHGVLTPDTALSWFPVLLAQVAELHRTGRLHGAISAAGITVDGSGRPVLGPPADTVVLRGDTEDTCLPELPPGRALKLPTNLAAARAQLTASGVDMDPRRIDVFQLGQLLCSTVSRQPTSVYLRSAKARGLVSAELQPLIDRALGYNQATRLENCEELNTLVMKAANPAGNRNQETSAQSAVQSPDTPRPPQQEVRSRATQPAVVVPAAKAPGAKPTAAKSDSASRPSADELPFKRLGAYEILERIGGGGMGDVYKAHDESLDRIVAIKVLPAELARQGDFVRRFRAEAMAIAKLTHPNIVQVFAFGEDAGRHFFAMQFVNGESLAQVLRRRGRLSLDEALPLFQQCLAGLGAAHQRELIHRDIKPGNILIDREHHRALVADFGLVKTADDHESMTATGVIMGTVDYLSPEQARGQQVDGRSDLYSLGALMYQALAGRLPFKADNPTGMIFQHAFDQPKPLCEVAPEVPEAVGAIVMRLLAKDPAQRFATAKEVSAAIQAFRAGKPNAAPVVGEAKANTGTLAPIKPASVAGVARRSKTPRRASWLDRWIGKGAGSQGPPRGGAIAAAGAAGFLTVVLGIWIIIRDRDGNKVARIEAPIGSTIEVKNAGASSEVKTPVNGGAEPAQPAARSADNRAAAEWALELGGKVRLLIHGEQKTVTATKDLPTENLHITRIDLRGTSPADAEFVHLENLRDLRDLDLGNTPTSDAALSHLRNDRNLSFVDLGKTKVTDAGLANLVGLPNLATLSLLETQTTDAGLEHVGKLATLTSLNLDHTKITDDGLSRLVSLKELHFLNLDGTKINDQGIKHLAAMKNLRTLILVKTGLTDEGLTYLEGLKSLTDLHVKGTHVTGAGIDKLRLALPACKITWDQPPGVVAAPPTPASSSSSQDSANRDPSKFEAGLLMTEYPRQPTQDSKGGGFVPREQLGDPVGHPSIIGSLSKWIYTRSRNAMAEGLLKIDVGGEYRFISANGGDLNALYVNGFPICQYGTGELTEAKIELKPGYVPIASISYVCAGGVATVQWAPPGQSQIGNIPSDRLFFSGNLRDRRMAEIANAAQKRKTQVPPSVPVNVGNYKPGLLQLNYARHSLQSPKDMYVDSVSPAEFGEPIQAVGPAGLISPWTVDREQNHIAFGYLRCEVGGEYAFYCNGGFSRCMLYVNGQLLFKFRDGEETVHRVVLKPGLVPLVVVCYVLNPQVNVLWQPPGQTELGPVPADALWHDPAANRPQFTLTSVSSGKS